jgi:hypothetical protein
MASSCNSALTTLATSRSPPGYGARAERVVMLSSRGHRRSDVDFDDPSYLHRPHDPWQAYGRSKTVN